jgi:hypothetical protein
MAVVLQVAILKKGTGLSPKRSVLNFSANDGRSTKRSKGKGRSRTGHEGLE